LYRGAREGEKAGPEDINASVISHTLTNIKTQTIVRNTLSSTIDNLKKKLG
jgi:hypothetical protein